MCSMSDQGNQVMGQRTRNGGTANCARSLQSLKVCLYETLRCKAKLAWTAATLGSHCTECFPDCISHWEMSRLPFPPWSVIFSGQHSAVQNRPSSVTGLTSALLQSVTGNSETESQLPSLLVFTVQLMLSKSLLCACRQD